MGCHPSSSFLLPIFPLPRRLSPRALISARGVVVFEHLLQANSAQFFWSAPAARRGQQRSLLGASTRRAASCAASCTGSCTASCAASVPSGSELCSHCQPAIRASALAAAHQCRVYSSDLLLYLLVACVAVASREIFTTVLRH
jgi:hypothetical protein